MFYVDEDRLSNELEYRAMSTNLQKLKSLNPLAAAFHISRKGKFDVINGLRLGWSEGDSLYSLYLVMEFALGGGIYPYQHMHICTR